jgi:hypothetical protein
MATLKDLQETSAEEIEILRNEIGVFKNLIKERKHTLDLVRELLSNAGAREVGASWIEITYTRGREGNVFEVADDGCGMNFTGSQKVPGRLDRFLGLGFGAIVGEKADEFAFKGLGSKLAYYSKRVEIETRFTGQPFYTVRINEPWSSLERNLLPKPQKAEYPESDEKPGTRIKVSGHPPYEDDEPLTSEKIHAYLLHRTFAGFTGVRANPPRISLSVLGSNEELLFGFPEFRGIDWPNGIALEPETGRLLVNIVEKAPEIELVRLKGFLTWDAGRYGLSKDNLNTGLILSSRGIPYFELDIRDYGARSIPQANPGVEGTCLIVECDGVHAQMNIARSDLVASPERVALRRAVRHLFERLEGSPDYLEFRKIPKEKKQVVSADQLDKVKREIESEDQNWVVFQRPGQKAILLMRAPQSEAEVNALLWKLEALGALPFHRFQSLAYVGAVRGPDLLASFQEDKTSEPLRSAVIEVENNFRNYTLHGHIPSQYPKVICWDVPSSGRKVRLNSTSKPYKWTVNMPGYQVHVYVLKQMDGIKVMSRRELREQGLDI